MIPVRRVAVLGAGTMGSRIAAHFANAGYAVDALDVSDELAVAGIERAAKQKPVAFYTAAARALIAPGNFAEDLDRVRECDWIIEAVAEDLEIKRRLWRMVAERRRPGSIVSTNTSGLPLTQIAYGFGQEFSEHFLGTHFFNPPRYLHLVEIIPGPRTLPAVLAGVSEFCDVRLGKGVTPCKDTPNFIANRIGSFFGSTVHKLTVEGGYTVEEVDALTGPLIGLPRSASFRLLDIIGLDVWAHVLRNLYDLVPNDPARGRYTVPEFMRAMLERGWLGEKTGQGFYMRVGKEREIHAIDLQTLEYHPAARPRFESVEAVKGLELRERLRALIAADDRVGRFLWPLFRDTMVYSAEMVPEISDRIVEIDRAMRWGYNFTYGPFELWDALGVEETVARMDAELTAVPEKVRRMLVSGARTFYETADTAGRPGMRYFDVTRGRYEHLEERPGVIVLAHWKRARGVVKSNAAASLVDLGDGALCVELHGKTNTLGDEALEMLRDGIAEASRNYRAMAVASQGEHFSVGADWEAVLEAARAGKWDEVDGAARRFQDANMAIKYAAVPVVAAPFGMTLGGGCEVVLHAARAQASAETYMGLVEAGAGVIPAGGGCKELLLRVGAKTAFELIGQAKTSGSAAEAREMGLLRASDGVTMNYERLIADAKAAALALVASYAAGAPRTDIAVGGEAMYATLKMSIYLAREAGYISEHDATIGEKLAHVLSGGRLTGEQRVSEQYLLDLEREAFLSLCGQAKTQERMEHLLKTGKALRN